MVKQERAARTCRALIQAAAETFAGEGYVRASLPVISERAGASCEQGALHFHFESKDALARAVEEEVACAVGRIIDSAQRRVVLTRLEFLPDVMCGLMPRIASDAAVRARFQMDGDVTRKGSRASRRWQAWVGEVLRQAERDGELAEGVSFRAMAMTVVAATVGLRVLAA